MKIGFHASHEQFAPGELLDLVLEAQQAGFQDAMCSDHLAPFSLRQGESGFAWSWLGAALAASSLTFGTVTAPGQRYHPVVTAQAVATLCQMFEGRLWVAFGSGEFLNEHVTGTGWPPKPVREQRLLECVQIIRALLAGETVTHKGEVTVSEARLYSLPRNRPLLLGAAITPRTAEWVGTWADGLITVFQPDGVLQSVVDAFRRTAGPDKPLYLQAQHAFSHSDEDALAEAVEQWAHSTLTSEQLTDLALPPQMDAAAASASPGEIAKRVRISSRPEQHLCWLQEYEEFGFDAVYVHNVTYAQREFIEAFGSHVLPHFSH